MRIKKETVTPPNFICRPASSSPTRRGGENLFCIKSGYGLMSFLRPQVHLKYNLFFVPSKKYEQKFVSKTFFLTLARLQSLAYNTPLFVDYKAWLLKP